MTESDDSQRTRVTEQLRHFSEQLPLALVVSVLVAVLFMVALWDLVDHKLLLGWFAVLVFTVVIRLWLILPVILGTDKTPEFTLARKSSLLVASAASGAVWGSAAVLFFDPANPMGFAIITMVIAGVAAGAIAPYSSWIPAYISFSVPMLLTLAARFLWENDSGLNMIGFMVLIYLALCIMTSANYQKFLIRSINLQFSNQDLLQELTELNEKLHEYSYTDPLTEIPNRRFFDDNLWQSLERAKTDAKSVSLLIIDVDYFKEYNDRYGHDEGDMVLKSIALNLRSLCSVPNIEVARVGGEEFTVIMFDADAQQVQAMAERIRETIERTYEQTEQTPDFGLREKVTVSLGVATSQAGNYLNARELFREADMGLYKAKGLGRNKVVVMGGE